MIAKPQRRHGFQNGNRKFPKWKQPGNRKAVTVLEDSSADISKRFSTCLPPRRYDTGALSTTTFKEIDHG